MGYKSRFPKNGRGEESQNNLRVFFFSKFNYEQNQSFKIKIDPGFTCMHCTNRDNYEFLIIIRINILGQFIKGIKFENLYILVLEYIG